MPITTPLFAPALIAWQRQHGRHALPWQNTRDAYRIWLSEIMLQQTQVITVIDYYQRFLERFPNVTDLAAAELEEVMQLWSGLGYYSRARHLHACAQQVVQRFDGKFPPQLELLISLPGIGRSTAAAISAFAYGTRAAILDGNVKRVLARVFAVEGWPNQPRIEKQLWALAESLLPDQNIEAYTQGLMDLGATLCVRSKPHCLVDPLRCPLQNQCLAHQQQRTAELPHKRPAKTLVREKQSHLLLALHKGKVLVEKRPPLGIWGGLWSLPQFDALDELKTYTQLYLQTPMAPQALPERKHSFTHFRLRFVPQLLALEKPPLHAQQTEHAWLALSEVKSAALPAPVKRLLLDMAHDLQVP